jgi:hypothetical protein
METEALHGKRLMFGFYLTAFFKTVSDKAEESARDSVHAQEGGTYGMSLKVTIVRN